MNGPGEKVRVGGTQAMGEKYILRLFVIGDESNSRQARQNLAQLCEEHLRDRYEIEVVDVLEDFETALENNVVVTPTLILVQPLPTVKILGNLSDREKVLSALRLTGGK